MKKPKTKLPTNPIAKKQPKTYVSLPQRLELIRESEYRSKK